MRKIQFKAKSINDGDYNGEWVYGYYMKSIIGGELVDVITDGANEIPIQKQTLCQSSNFLDKNFDEIYEGDILKYGDETFTIVFQHGCFGYVYCKQFVPLGTNTNFRFCKIGRDSDFEIRGNIYGTNKLIE